MSSNVESKDETRPTNGKHIITSKDGALDRTVAHNNNNAFKLLRWNHSPPTAARRRIRQHKLKTTNRLLFSGLVSLQTCLIYRANVVRIRNTLIPKVQFHLGSKAYHGNS